MISGVEFGISMEPRGVETDDKVPPWLFLRRGGKYPSVFLGMRAISTGFEEGDESIRTQRTWVHGRSSSGSARSAEVWYGEEELPGHEPPFVKVGDSSVSGVGASKSTP